LRNFTSTRKEKKKRGKRAERAILLTIFTSTSFKEGGRLLLSSPCPRPPAPWKGRRKVKKTLSSLFSLSLLFFPRSGSRRKEKKIREGKRRIVAFYLYINVPFPCTSPREDGKEK